MKDPPDKYKTLKCSPDSLLKFNNNSSIIFDAVVRTHKLTIHVYQFIRLWLLQKYHNNEELPILTTKLIKLVYKVLSIESSGPKSKNSYYNELLEFYDTHYKQLNRFNKLDASHLSQIIGYSCTDILTNIENNIKLNYIKYINRFVNSSFSKDSKKGLYQIKKDIQENTLLSNEKYHNWINLHKFNIIPITINNKYTLQHDLDYNPQFYLSRMIYMCKELENNNTKSFQFFPLRNDIIPKYISIDTKSIIELFITSNLNEYLKNITECKHELWDKYFNLNNKIFRQNHYQFDYRISTDGFSVSIQFINNKYIEQSNKKKENMKNKRNEIRESTKNMTKEQITKYKDELKEVSKLKNKEYKLKQQTKLKQLKAEFKQLSDQDKRKILKKDCPYLEDLTKEQIENLKKSKWICCDPGKNTLLYFKSNDGITFRYTNRTHIKRTKRLKYQSLLQNYKNKKDISKIENELSKFNSKSCNIDKFKEFIENKNRINNILFEEYENKIFRQYKWYNYINKQRTEMNLVNDIKKIFGKDIIIIYGDWSKGNEQRGIISTPNKAIKKVLMDNFIVYSIDEFRTSKLNCKTEEETKNIYLSDNKGIKRKIHSILTFQMENNRLGCINRDNNAVTNMIKIVNHFLETGKRPFKFTRECKLKIKNDNLQVDNNKRIKKVIDEGHKSIKKQKDSNCQQERQVSFSS